MTPYNWYFSNFDRTASSYYMTTPDGEAFRNAALALCSEASEFLEHPCSEELGDNFWYLAMLCKQAHVDFNAVMQEAHDLFRNSNSRFEAHMVIGYLVRQVGLLASLLKKSAEKRLAFETLPVRPLLVKIAHSLLEAAAHLTISPFAVLEENLKKLAARHPNGQFNAYYKSEGETC